MSTKHNLPIIDAEAFNKEPERYQLRKGSEEGAPACPYGNEYEWVGFDLKAETYVRFTKRVFKRLISQVIDD